MSGKDFVVLLFHWSRSMRFKFHTSFADNSLSLLRKESQIEPSKIEN